MEEGNNVDSLIGSLAQSLKSSSEEPELSGPPPGNNLPPVGTVTVIECVYHRPSPNDEANLTEARFTRTLTTNEESYIRKNHSDRLKANSEWRILDYGWVENPSMLMVYNDEGKRFRVVPEKKELDDIKQRIIELCLESPKLDGANKILILPGESIRLVVSDFDSISIRCQYQSAKYTLTVIPE